MIISAQNENANLLHPLTRARSHTLMLINNFDVEENNRLQRERGGKERKRVIKSIHVQNGFHYYQKISHLRERNKKIVHKNNDDSF